MPLFQEKGFEMDENGRTCLHYAVWGGSPRVMRYLVEWCGFDLGLRTAVSFAYLIISSIWPVVSRHFFIALIKSIV